jgi:hypothetical protein
VHFGKNLRNNSPQVTYGPCHAPIAKSLARRRRGIHSAKCRTTVCRSASDSRWCPPSPPQLLAHHAGADCSTRGGAAHAAFKKPERCAPCLRQSENGNPVRVTCSWPVGSSGSARALPVLVCLLTTHHHHFYAYAQRSCTLMPPQAMCMRIPCIVTG